MEQANGVVGGGKAYKTERTGREWTTRVDFGESGKFGRTAATLVEVVNDGGGGLGDGAEEGSGVKR